MYQGSGVETATSPTDQARYSAKLVWFAQGPAWTCQKYGKHVVTIHWGDTAQAKAQAIATAQRLELLPDTFTVNS